MYKKYSPRNAELAEDLNMTVMGFGGRFWFLFF